MIGYQRLSHSTESVLPPRITTAVKAVTALLHVVMPSSPFISGVENMPVFMKLKFNGNLGAM